MQWKILLSRKAAKQLRELNEKIVFLLSLLVNDLEQFGPFPGKAWPNYSKLNAKKNEDKRHCHLCKGKITYVCCWEVIDKQARIIEIYYVGTHEKAPY